MLPILGEPKKQRGRPRSGQPRETQGTVYFIQCVRSGDVKFIGYYTPQYSEAERWNRLSFPVKTWMRQNPWSWKVLAKSDKPQLVAREFIIAAHRLGFKILNK